MDAASWATVAHAVHLRQVTLGGLLVVLDDATARGLWGPGTFHPQDHVEWQLCRHYATCTTCYTCWLAASAQWHLGAKCLNPLLQPLSRLPLQ